MLFSQQVLKAQTDSKDKAYEFKMIKEIQTTPVKDQYRSSTCWSFATISFLETEMIRTGKPEIDLSEAWVVRNAYSDKAVKYVRLQGNLNFAGGGASHDVTNCIKRYGMVPEEVYQGLNYGTEKFVHGELDAVLKGYVESVIKNPNKELTPAWHNGFNGILDAYFGEIPNTFNYKGKEYTPTTFAKDYLGINPDDYIEITSYSHHPYYSQFVFELPDNWDFGLIYNVKLDELVEIIDYAIGNGYSVIYGGDVSEKGFSWKNGIAIMPDINVEETSGSDKEHWTTMSKDEKEKVLYSFEKPVKEMEITPEMRQKGFDNYRTSDDHSMHIIGIAEDQNGNKFYKLKNSWDTDNIYNGYLYMSEAFLKYKINNIMVSKNAVPKEIAKKLKL
ncbi:MAG TPA: aminopeptidase [Bacteroidales bacterium]|nr:aminopeptidase [Bacteroidales bacterium]